jgi:hypothetical protein
MLLLHRILHLLVEQDRVEVKWAQYTIPGYSHKVLIFKQWHRRFVSQLELVVYIWTAKVPFPEGFDLSRFLSLVR